MIFQKIILEW